MLLQTEARRETQSHAIIGSDGSLTRGRDVKMKLLSLVVAVRDGPVDCEFFKGFFHTSLDFN